MSAKIEICNAALALIGERSIASLDDDVLQARTLKAIYDITRKSMLRSHPWSCAKKRIALSPVATAPSFGYGSAFALPTDFMRLIDVGGTEFEVENGTVLADADVLNLVYVYDNTTEETWDALMCDAMTHLLASRICKPLTGSDAAGQAALANYQFIIKQARSVNGQEQPSQEISTHYESYLLSARR